MESWCARSTTVEVLEQVGEPTWEDPPAGDAELNHITELANDLGSKSWPTWRRNFLGREVYALAAALAIMFATSMTPDQARILNDNVTLEACPAMATGQAFELSATVRGGGRHIYPPVLPRWPISGGAKGTGQV